MVTQIKDLNGPDSAAGPRTFSYNGAGERVFVNDGDGGRYWSYDKGKLLQEKDTSGTVIAVYKNNDCPQEATAGPVVEILLPNGNLAYNAMDNVGSVVQVVQPSPASQNSYYRDSFGVQLSSSTPLNTTIRLQFASRFMQRLTTQAQDGYLGLGDFYLPRLSAFIDFQAMAGRGSGNVLSALWDWLFGPSKESPPPPAPAPPAPPPTPRSRPMKAEAVEGGVLVNGTFYSDAWLRQRPIEDPGVLRLPTPGDYNYIASQQVWTPLQLRQNDPKAANKMLVGAVIVGGTLVLGPETLVGEVIIGGIGSGSYSAGSQYIDTGRINPRTVLVDTGLGALGAGGFSIIGRGASSALLRLGDGTSVAVFASPNTVYGGTPPGLPDLSGFARGLQDAPGMWDFVGHAAAASGGRPSVIFIEGVPVTDPSVAYGWMRTNVPGFLQNSPGRMFCCENLQMAQGIADLKGDVIWTFPQPEQLYVSGPLCGKWTGDLVPVLPSNRPVVIVVPPVTTWDLVAMPPGP